MSRIKQRWFNVSQAINRDPEVRQLKRELGLTGFSMWLEVLAETDGMEDGIWRGSDSDIGRVLAGVCESNTRGSAKLLQWITDRGWVTWLTGSEPGNRRDLKVVNHAKYHPTRKANSGSPFLPSVPSEPSDDKAPIVPKGDDDSRFYRLWNAWPEHRRRQKWKAYRVWKRINPDANLYHEIMAKLEQLKKSREWEQDNGRFIPFLANWLNAEGWEDEVDDFLGNGQRRMSD